MKRLRAIIDRPCRKDKTNTALPVFREGRTYKILRHAAVAAAQDDAGFRFFAWVGGHSKLGTFRADVGIGPYGEKRSEPSGAGGVVEQTTRRTVRSRNEPSRVNA